MAEKNYEIAHGDYSSPAQSYESDNNNGVSSDTAQRYLLAVRDIVNECIERRITDGQDIAKVYNAEITQMRTAALDIGSVTVGDDIYSVTNTVPTHITVRYNEDDYTDISNETVQLLSPNDKWCKICTYDGVQFYVLHKL